MSAVAPDATGDRRGARRAWPSAPRSCSASRTPWCRRSPRTPSWRRGLARRWSTTSTRPRRSRGSPPPCSSTSAPSTTSGPGRWPLAAESAAGRRNPLGARPRRRRRAGVPHPRRPRPARRTPRPSCAATPPRSSGLAGAGAGGRGVDSTAAASRRPSRPPASSAAAPAGPSPSPGWSTSSSTATARCASAAGTPLLTRTTGAGCSLGALVAAYAAVEPRPAGRGRRRARPRRRRRGARRRARGRPGHLRDPLARRARRRRRRRRAAPTSSARAPRVRRGSGRLRPHPLPRHRHRPVRAPRGARGGPRGRVAGGVTAVQVRAKDGSDRERLALVLAVQDALRGTGVPLFVNDAVDIALIAGVDGVHLGQSDLPAEDVRRIAPGLLLGLSVSTAEEVRRGRPGRRGLPRRRPGLGHADEARRRGRRSAPRASRPSWRPPRCPASRSAGSTPRTSTRCAARGIAGFCVVSEICAAEDPEAAARSLRTRSGVPEVTVPRPVALTHRGQRLRRGSGRPGRPQDLRRATASTAPACSPR